MNQNNQKRPPNPLDLILGEKILDYKTKEIRPDNFEDFLNLKRGNFTLLKSDIYNVTAIEDSILILTQSKTYLDAQKYSVIVKLNGENVFDYHVIYNSDIIDVLLDKGDIYG